MTETVAMDYPVNRAFALAAFHAETNPACALERIGAGYLAQEAARQCDTTP